VGWPAIAAGGVAARLAALWLLAAAACAQRPVIYVLDPAFDPPGPDWLQAARSPDSNYFMSTTDTLRYGSVVRVWMMRNLPLNVPSGEGGLRSIRYKAEFDCRAARTRAMLVSTFTGVNATGSIIATNIYGTSDWLALAPDSVGSDNARLACALVPPRRAA
jgi:hypothetical protein